MVRYLIILSFILLTACSKEITINMPIPETKIVVEGSIENGSPPLVMLTNNQPYFSSIDLQNLDTLFVKGADVSIELEGVNYPLTQLSIPVDAQNNIYIYTSFSLIGEIGKTYSLIVSKENKILRATTTIPNPVDIDSLYWLPHPKFDEGNDSLASLHAIFQDPDSMGNYYRYFTKRNSEDYKSGYFGSVWDDLVFNGQKFDVPFERGMNRTEEFDPSTYSYFWKGDTVCLKISSLEKSTFSFWRTLEQDIGSNGNPFGIPTKVMTNIEGGLGVWCGYGSSIDTIIIQD